MEKFQDRFFEEIREKLKNLGIKVVLFDFDDTLIYTQELFTKYMDMFISTVSSETGLDQKVVREDLERLNNEEYKTRGVNPERWRYVVERMVFEREGYGKSPINNLVILMQIYLDNPRLKPGSVAMLEILKTANVRMALVTHANKEWTLRKLESTGVAHYFETIKVVDENKHKGIDDWMAVAEEMGVNYDECLTLGDSLGGDIIPSAQMGARTMWLHKGNTWSMYRTGQLPENTVILDELTQMLSALETMR